MAHGAHIGGFLAGLGAAWVFDRSEVTATPAEYAAREPLAQVDLVQAAIDRGDMEAAAQAYFATPTGARLAPATALALGDWLAAHGHAQAALVVYRRLLRDQPTGPGSDEAHLGAGLAELQRGQLAPAYQHLQQVLDSDAAPETQVRAADALRVIAEHQKYPLRRFAQRTS